MDCYWVFSLVATQVWLSTANEIFHVLPDASTNVSCSLYDQSCATLSQYLLDNGSLPVVSNVEYHFLPGEHHVPASMTLQNLQNFSIIGTSSNLSSPVILVGLSQSHVIDIINSHFVTITNVVFKHFGTSSVKQEITNLKISCCFSCKIENITFIQYGFIGINLIGESYMCNIKCEVMQFSKFSHHKIFLQYTKCPLWDSYSNHSHLKRNQYLLYHIMHIIHIDDLGLYINTDFTFYHINIVLENSRFYNADDLALQIKTRCSYTTTITILVKNCTFNSILNTFAHYEPIIYLLALPINRNIHFVNCKFHNNTGQLIVITFNMQNNIGCKITANLNKNFSSIVTNISFVRCQFMNNTYTTGELISINNDITTLGKANVLFECLNIFKCGIQYIFSSIHKMNLILVSGMNVHINGPVNITENSVELSVVQFYSCDILFSGKIFFDTNYCTEVIYLDTYIKVMENANITFVNNRYHNNLIVVGSVDKHYQPHPFCLFQYIAIKSDTIMKDLVMVTHYAIVFSDNMNLLDAPRSPLQNTSCSISFCHFLSHCKWLTSAAFYDHSPEAINKRIIQDRDQNCNYHKCIICYCSENIINCTINMLGPVYPGQTLQANLCNMCDNGVSSVLYAEVHNINLPSSACKISHQSQLINVIGNHSNTVNYTIVSSIPRNNRCELFLTTTPFLNQIYTAFYVQLLPCPIGFTLQDGMCDCDPILPAKFHNCYIDHSTIKRPASTWITAHAHMNSTKYLISDCPMDYCLPYQSHVSLHHPDLQCQFNRTGFLCSQCQHPLSMVFGSSRCIECTNVHILITIIVIVSGIVLVVSLYILNLTITKGTINGLIFYANIVSINDSVFLVNDNVFKPLSIFISFVNLDLGFETCFYNGMDSYFKMWLQLFFPAYLVIIAASIIIASRYSSKILRLTFTRSLPVLATLFLLSYTGVLRTVLTVLFSYSTITHLPSGHHQIVWSIDASVPLFGFKFTILFITCLVLFLLLIFINIIVLFTRSRLDFRMINRFKPILDAVQGSYKDRYYYWVAVHITMRSLFFAMYAFQRRLKLVLSTILLIIFSIYSGRIYPHKSKLVNLQELLLLINLTIMYAVSYQANQIIFSIVTNFMISLAFIQFVTILLYHILTYTCHCNIELALQALKDRLMNLCCKNHLKHNPHFDTELLNIPECTYNYAEYQDGLVSDDFN